MAASLAWEFGNFSPSPFQQKQLKFADEQKARAVVQCFNYKLTNRPDAEMYDYARDVCEVAMPVAVGPAGYSQEVVVSLYIESWMLDLDRSDRKRNGMTIPN